MIPAGKYTARATGPQDAEFGEKDGRTYLFVRYQIKGGPCDGQMIGNFFRFASEAQAQWSRVALGTSGCTFEKGYKDMTGLGSRDVSLVVEVNERNGKPYSDIKYINSIGGVPEDQKLSPSDLDDFEKQMTAFCGPAPIKPKPAETPIDEAEIPF